MTVRVSAAICDNKAKAGDEILATLDQDVYAGANATLPAGTIVILDLQSVNVAPADTSAAQPFIIQAHTIRWDDASIPLNAQVRIPQVDRVKRPINKANIVKGAIGGAIVGFLAKRDVKAAAEGAAAGAAVGTGVSMARRGYDLCIPSGAPLVLTLSSALTKTS